MESSEAAETKCIITSLLTSNPVRCSIRQLCLDFANTVGYRIPFRQLGFTCIEDYLRSIPDTVTIYGSGLLAEVEGVIKPKSAHINELVAKQKKTNILKHKRMQFYPKRRQPFSNFYVWRRTFSVDRPSTSPDSVPKREFNVDESQALPHRPSSPPNLTLKCEFSDGSQELPQSNCSKEEPQAEGTSSPSEGYSDISPSRKRSWAEISSEDETSSSSKEYRIKIPARIEDNLKKLILEFPEGIWCTQLPAEYSKMFKRSLRFEKYGYRSLIELCANLPEIFQYVQPTLDDYLLYDKNKTIPPFEQTDMASLALVQREIEAKTSIWNELPKLGWDMGSILIPPDVLHPGDKIPRYPIGDSYQVGDYLDIAVGEIYDPSKFWITDPYGKLKPLMNNLQTFFCNQRNKYLIPESLLEEGLYCICLFVRQFHRAVIVNLLPNVEGFVRVLFVDYGTVSNVQSNEIWYLPKQFAELEYQATRARLASIYPVYVNQPWSGAALRRFEELITYKPLVGEITRINYQYNVLEIYLADITSEHNIFYINDVLVKEGHALYTNQERKQSFTDPDCIPRVEYIHLYPEFEEIEAGFAPTTEEKNYILMNKIPMHYYMPQYFDISFSEDVKYVEKQYEQFIKTVHDSTHKDASIEGDVDELTSKVASVEGDFDYSFFPSDLQGKIKDLVKDEEVLKSKSCSDQTVASDVPKVPSCGEKQSDESVRQYFCNKKRISELIYGDRNKPSTPEVQSSESNCSIASQGEITSLSDSLQELSLNAGDFSVTNNVFGNKSANPFVSANDNNPFRMCAARSTNPFVSDIEQAINTGDLFEVFSKSSEENLPEKIVNNLNSSSPPCTCKLNKQVNKPTPAGNSADFGSPNALNAPPRDASASNPPSTNDGSRRIRTPPGFQSSLQDLPFDPNYLNSLYYSQMAHNFANNPYYQRQSNNGCNPQSQFCCLQNSPQLQNYLNFVPQICPTQFQFSLGLLQQALAAQAHNQQAPPQRNAPSEAPSRPF